MSVKGYKKKWCIEIMDKLILELLRRNAHKKPLKVSTTELGELCGISQQNTSRKLISLENDGLIRRTSEGLILTELGENSVKKEYLELKQIFEKGPIRIHGEIVEGSNEGKYYLSQKHYKQEIKKEFGFTPYPGTLNIKIREEDILKREEVLKKEFVTIPGFVTEKRTYGELYAYPAKLNGIEVVIIIPLRTHHGKEIIEIISENSLKDKIENRNKVLLEIE